MPKLAPEALERAAAAIFESAGVPRDEAQIVSRHLVEANLAGHDSHGVLRIPQYAKALQTGRVKPGVKPQVLNETATTASLDAQGGFGQVAARYAVSLAMNKARQSGIAAVTVRNSYHTGRIGSYTLMAAEQGFVSLAMVNGGGGGQSVAPFGGIERRLATNPISIAAPAPNGQPLVFDIATSVAAEGKLRDCFQKGKSVPAGWMVDSLGHSSTNPKEFYDRPGGALLPLGGPVGHKGFGLGFMIDILAGALSGAGVCRPDAPEPKDGLLMIALEVQRFLPMEAFHAHVAQLIAHVKSCPPAPGFKEVYVPGELERREQQRRRTEGIEVDQRTWGDICEVAAEVGVNLGEVAFLETSTAPTRASRS
jgi:uncharacterized oxidoreductase